VHKIDPYLQPIKLTNPEFSDFQLTLGNNFKYRIAAAYGATFKLLPLSKVDKDALDLVTELSWEANLFSAMNDSFTGKNFKKTCKNFKIGDLNEVSCPSLLINDLLKNMRTTEVMELMVLGGVVTATFSNGKIIKDLLPEKEAAIGQIKLTNDMAELIVGRTLRIIQPIKPGKYYYGFEAEDGSFMTEFYRIAAKECSLIIFQKFDSIFNKAEESTKGLIEKNHLSGEQLNGQLVRLYNIKKTWEDATKNMNVEDIKNEIQKSKKSLIVDYEKAYSISHLFLSSKKFEATLDSLTKTGNNKITNTGDKPVDLKKE